MQLVPRWQPALVQLGDVIAGVAVRLALLAAAQRAALGWVRGRT